MKILLRAVITGFGLSVGAALYKRVAKQLGVDDDKSNDAKDAAARAGAAASDPNGLRTEAGDGDAVTDAVTDGVTDAVIEPAKA